MSSAAICATVGSSILSAVILLFVVLLGGMIIASTFSIGSIDVMKVFSDDESFAVSRVLVNLKEGNLDPHGFYNYGYLYHSLGYVILKLFSAMGFNDGSVQTVAMCLRLISVFSFLSCGIIVFLILQSLSVNRHLSGAFSLLFLVYNNFVYWGYHIHPDVLQTLFVLLSIYSIVKFRNYWLVLVFSSAFLGAAFGTKYSGLFGLILPIGFVVLSSASVIRVKSFKCVLGRAVFSLLLILAVFFVIWCVTNPYILSNTGEFLKDFAFEKDHIAAGHNLESKLNGFLWFRVMLVETSPWALLLIAAGWLFSAFFLLRKLRRPKSNEITPNEDFKSGEHGVIFLLFIYCIISFSYLFFTVNMRVARFLFHVWPAMIIVGAWGLSRVLQFRRILTNNVGAVLLSFVVATVSIPIYRQAFYELGNEIGNKQHNQFVEAGKWLEKHYDGSKSILAGFYSYIPLDHFKKAVVSYEVGINRIKRMKPDIIVYNREIPGRFIWKKNGTTLEDLDYVFGKSEIAKQHQRAMEYLLSENSAYKIVYEKEDIVIFSK